MKVWAFLSTILLLQTAQLSGLSSVGPQLAWAGDSSPANVEAAVQAPKKIVIFYSSIGQGHLSAARTIAKQIDEDEPGTQVVLKDIRDFMPPLKRKLDEKLYWFVIKNLPSVFEKGYQSMQQKGRQAASLSDLKNNYPEAKVLAYLDKEKPTAIIATHYGSAQVLGNLREEGKLQDTKIGWVHTDFFEGYFPRISKRIDKTFLPHDSLGQDWLKAGVNPGSVIVSGMPIQVQAHGPIDRDAFLREQKLDPKVKTVVIAAGKEGVADFEAAVKSISNEIHDPVQIVAICGGNSAQLKKLVALSTKLPSNVRLRPLGFIPQQELIGYVRSSDVYITKAGGLSPTESFHIGKPTVLLSSIGGHERENAQLFQKLGLAEINENVPELGGQVRRLMNDPVKQERMLEAQQKFRDGLDLSSISRFALDPNEKPAKAPSNFGLEGSVPAQGVDQALAKLDRDSPADIEVLLSYSSTKKDQYIDPRANPFGHISIRLGDTVYTANHHADPSVDTQLLAESDLKQYLFGTEAGSPTQQHASAYGMSYGRDTLGLRIQGVSPESMKQMREEADRIQEEFRTGVCRWELKTNNCADFTKRILKAGGYDLDQMPGPNGKISMPLDVFDKMLHRFENDPRYKVDIVAYNRLPSSQNPLKFSRFPLSANQKWRSFRHWLNDPMTDPLERKVTKRIVGYASDPRVHYENASRLAPATCLIEDLQKSFAATAPIQALPGTP